MLKIGKTRLERADGSTRLCADLTVGDRRTTLWFAADSAQEEYLAPGRADAFVMALLPGAMRGKHEIVCEDPMSERLHHQLVNALIPTLAFAGGPYHRIRITAPLTAEKLPNRGAVGTGFSGGVDSLYTVMSHGRDSELPLTHIAVFNNGHIWEKDVFQTLCRYARRFAEEQGLAMTAVDSNIHDALGERFLDVQSFRNIACALALGRLFSVYLLSSSYDAAHFKLNFRDAPYFDLLTTRQSSTEALAFYHAGEEATRVEKLALLSDWEPSRRWLHPCFRTGIDRLNCGHCKKCVRDMTALYVLGRLERYREVYDVEDYLRHLPQRLGVLLAFGDGRLCDETIQLLKDRNIRIPQKAFVYERQFRLAMRHLESEQRRGMTGRGQ